jgi:hypothetical protein
MASMSKGQFVTVLGLVRSIARLRERSVVRQGNANIAVSERFGIDCRVDIAYIRSNLHQNALDVG